MIKMAMLPSKDSQNLRLEDYKQARIVKKRGGTSDQKANRKVVRE